MFAVEKGQLVSSLLCHQMVSLEETYAATIAFHQNGLNVTNLHQEYHDPELQRGSFTCSKVDFENI